MPLNLSVRELSISSLSVSNLAWNAEHNEQAKSILSLNGVGHIEVVPAKIKSNPLTISKKDAVAYRQYWEKDNVNIIALQSLLFGGGNFQLFGSSDDRKQLKKYLYRIAELTSWLGADVMVFGSPKIRVYGELGHDAVMDIATTFFEDIAKFAAERGTCFCIEPNPEYYGCEFIVSSIEGFDFVSAIAHPGLRLHLDTGAMQLANEDPVTVSQNYLNVVKHIHISEIGLKSVGIESQFNFHSTFAKSLLDNTYSKFVSIEMLDIGLDSLASSIGWVRTAYNLN